MKKEIKLPEKLTQEHNTLAYFNKLAGKIIRTNADPAPTNGKYGKVITCIQTTQRVPNNKSFPSAVRYKTETFVLEISFLVMCSLIEGGYAMDAFGFEYEVIN